MENILRKGEFSCFKLSFSHNVYSDESRIAWVWAKSPTPEKNVGQKMFAMGCHASSQI